jgi:hypothetical protein
VPYVSEKQRAYMHIHHPEIAKRWDAEYGGGIRDVKKDPKLAKRRRRRARR